jgi:uncharacterized protein (UPF0276 family)
MTQGSAGGNPIRARAGIGLRALHYRDILDMMPPLGLVEVHSENYFAAGGEPHYYLEQIRSNYALSLHGVGLSLGSVDPLNLGHLRKLKSLVARYAPALVSEHLCWGSVGGRYFNDLLPLPYTEEALRHIADRISEAQVFLGRPMLIENVSSYLQFKHSTIPEWEFLAEVSVSSGCGILLDVNNIYVNAVNHHFDPITYVESIPVDAVQEIHLAGFDDGGKCLIDTHGKPVCDDVWELYRHAIQRMGRVPTLIEWDTEIPPLSVLLGEACKADAILEQSDALAG